MPASVCSIKADVSGRPEPPFDNEDLAGMNLGQVSLHTICPPPPMVSTPTSCLGPMLSVYGREAHLTDHRCTTRRSSTQLAALRQRTSSLYHLSLLAQVWSLSDYLPHTPPPSRISHAYWNAARLGELGTQLENVAKHLCSLLKNQLLHDGNQPKTVIFAQT